MLDRPVSQPGGAVAPWGRGGGIAVAALLLALRAAGWSLSG
jgi:hypothetical protein